MKNQTFVVALHDRTIYEVPKHMADKIFETSSKKDKGFIKLKDNMISLSSISQITEAENYYRQHPEKKQRDISNEYKNFSLPEPKQLYSEERHQKKLEKMKNGFFKGVAKARELSSVSYNDLKKHQIEIYNRMEQSLKALETQGTADNRWVMGRDN